MWLRFLESSGSVKNRGLFRRGAAREHGRKNQTGDENRDADQLRRGQPGMNMVRRIITAEIFHDGAEDRVKNQVGRKNLAVEFLAAEQPREKDVKHQVQDGVVNFGRVQSNAQRGSRILARLRVREGNGPGQIASAAIATPVEQATDPPETTADRAAGGKNIGG